MFKTTSKVILVFTAATALSGCGLRGGLERPPPIFGSQTNAAPEVVLPPAEEVQTVDEGPRFNELGGEIPEPSPVDPVDEDALEDPEE